MAKNLTREINHFYENRIKLDELLNSTKKVINEFKILHIFDNEKLIDELLPPNLMKNLNSTLNNNPALVVLGPDNKSKATFINNLLSCNALPLANEDNWKWVKFQFNKTPSINLSLGLKPDFIDDVKNNFRAWIDFTVDTLKAIGKYDKLDWSLIKSPSLINQDDLTVLKLNDPTSPITVEAKLDNPLLKDISIYVAPQKAAETLKKNQFGIIPLFVYVLGEDFISAENLEELQNLEENYPSSRILFLTSIPLKDVPESKKMEEFRAFSSVPVNKEEFDSLSKKIEEAQHLKQELLSKIWEEQLRGLGYTEVQISNLSDQPELLANFIIDNVKNILSDCSRRLNEAHSSGLRKIILSAFDMSREIDITPKRLDYVRKMENELYKKLMDEMYDEEKTLMGLIEKIIEEMKDTVNSQDIFNNNNNNNERESGEDIEELALNLLTRKITEALVASTECLQEMFTGTLQRSLLKLEEGNRTDNCNFSASSALNKILSVAYNVKLQDISSSMFIKSLKCPSLSTPPKSNFDTSWREKMFHDVLHSISSSKLSHTISARFKQQVQNSHEEFQAALKLLECHLFNKLKLTEQRKFAIRKKHAPQLARLELESNSLCDLIQQGLPKLNYEIGRGAFGVVFACNWGSTSQEFAVKSLVPHEEAQWNDLAMEFYYTRSIPDHERILKLRGSVIEKVHGFTKILLITDKMAMDLHRGLRQGLSFLQRIQIAIDVSKGIRYLHSLGLIHRDIKMKNVLLDTERRAKLSDFGFCVTQAMLSGSVVGSPIHMAPELIVGNYDSSVDVYAFGILFWYICAGTVNLPLAFQEFDNKEDLWIKVRKGVRPERLPSFSKECWRLMTQCWDADPSKRPLLGAIMPVLESVRENILKGLKNPSDDAGTQKNVPEHGHRNKMVQTAPVFSMLSIIRNCKRHVSSM